jgi:hypothetical protein
MAGALCPHAESLIDHREYFGLVFLRRIGWDGRCILAGLRMIECGGAALPSTQSGIRSGCSRLLLLNSRRRKSPAWRNLGGVLRGITARGARWGAHRAPGPTNRRAWCTIDKPTSLPASRWQAYLGFIRCGPGPTRWGTNRPLKRATRRRETGQRWKALPLACPRSRRS